MSITKTLVGSVALLALGTGAGYLLNRQDTKGVPPLFGQDPLMPVVGGNAVYYRIVYLKFAGTADEPSLTVRHAVFKPIPGQDDDVAAAAEVVRAGKAITGKPTVVGEIYSNFEHFGFKSKQRVYVAVDNDRVGFQKATPISFTPYGANEAVANRSTEANPHQQKDPTRKPNNSFFNAGFIKIELAGKQREILKFDNLLKASNGAQIEYKPTGPSVEKAKFSINFNLNMCTPLQNPCDLTNPKHIIPFVIDPDTGNGLGTPPPY